MSHTLPEAIYSTQQVRELDRLAIETHGIGAYALMQRAAAACFECLCNTWPNARRLRVYCGSGNNGGDGYVIARLAAKAGWAVELISVGDHSRLSGAALSARQDWLALQQDMTFDTPDVVVDAIFGTGLSRPPQGEWLQAIEQINQTPAPVLAVDIPSGLDSDTGMPQGEAVIATRTLTFIGMKQGLVTGRAADYTGVLQFDDLGLPHSVYAALVPAATRLTHRLLAHCLPPRQPSSHKGCFGHALLVGGQAGMQGAIQLAAEACARSGAGLTTLVSHDGMPPRAEIMACRRDDPQAYRQALARATVIATGPGLGTGETSARLFAQALASCKPLVVDADALRLLAASPQYHDHWILTPHPGEAAALLGISSAEVQQHRYQAVRALQQKYGGVCVLKGWGSVLDNGQHVSVCTAGNPGMASGGMGDVLTGIITGLLAQHLSLHDAARTGVYLHARAADLAARELGERGLLAADLFGYLRGLLNQQILTRKK